MKKLEIYKSIAQIGHSAEEMVFFVNELKAGNYVISSCAGNLSFSGGIKNFSGWTLFDGKNYRHHQYTDKLPALFAICRKNPMKS
jgi:hypothetical protein